MSRIVVTGIGIISAIGSDLTQNLQSLRNGRSGITTEMDLFVSKYAGLLPFGVVKKSTEALKEKLHADESGITRSSLLALHAFEEAIRDSCLTAEQVTAFDTALIGSSTVGGMCLTDELYHDSNKNEQGSPYLASYDNASVALYLQNRFQLRGIINTINTACSSSANAIMYGTNLLRNNMAKRVIAGGADSLAKFTINGFNALYILSKEPCRPFDANRNGLNLGEGAAFLVLEKEEDVKGKKIYAVVSGCCNTNDAFHPSSLSENGEGPLLAMKGALQQAKLKPSEIDFINAHGTGTENNDEVESKAMIRLFNHPPVFASTKSYTGHTLGASGAIEAVFSILNILHQEIYPNLRFEQRIPSTGLTPLRQFDKRHVNHVMSNSFGFGGNCSSLIFSKA